MLKNNFLHVIVSHGKYIRENVLSDKIKHPHNLDYYLVEYTKNSENIWEQEYITDEKFDISHKIISSIGILENDKDKNLHDSNYKYNNNIINYKKKI